MSGAGAGHRRHQETLPALLCRLEVLAVRPLPWRLFSWFSLGHLFKETFFNDLIISKRSSRGGVSGYSDHVVKLFIISSVFAVCTILHAESTS